MSNQGKCKSVKGQACSSNNFAYDSVSSPPPSLTLLIYTRPETHNNANSVSSSTESTVTFVSSKHWSCIQRVSIAKQEEFFFQFKPEKKECK